MAYDVEQLLITESGRIGADIYQKTVNTSPWLKLVKQDAWPDELGKTLTVLTFERSLPLNVDGSYKPQTWTALGENTGGDDGNGNCNPSANRLEWGQGTRTYSIDQSALESPDLCVNDLRHPVHRKEQLSAIMKILTANTSYVWVERFRDEYVRLAEHKVVLAPNGAGECPEDDEAFPLTLPTTKLTPAFLKRFYQKLVREGAGDTAVDRENGRPLFIAIMSSEQSEHLLTVDPDFRQDIRWSTKANDLLAPLGVERSYKGFFHLIDDFAPRYDFVSGAWVRRYPYYGLPATARGKRLEINPDYENAAYEDVIIFHPNVFENLVPKPITSPGGGTSFDPVNYRGDFKWLNIQDRDNNPDKTIGFFRGVFQSASKPISPEYGYVLRVLRCGGIPFDRQTCSE
jgi:hypothetical protein